MKQKMAFLLLMAYHLAIAHDDTIEHITTLAAHGAAHGGRQPPTPRPADGRWSRSRNGRGDCDQWQSGCTLKVLRKECMRLSRPQRYDGRGDAQVLDEFVAGLRTYLHFYTLELPPEQRCHKTINVGFLKKFRESTTFKRTLPRRATTRGQAARSHDATEVLETRTTTRRERTRQEFLVKWPGERQAQWRSTEKLRAPLPHDELLSILGPEGN